MPVEFSRATRSTSTPVRISMPSPRSPSATRAAANGSQEGRSPLPRTSMVTWEPNALQAAAISHPTTPPPRTTSLLGAAPAVVASLLVHAPIPAKPGTDGSTALDPVHSTTA